MPKQDKPQDKQQAPGPFGAKQVLAQASGGPEGAGQALAQAGPGQEGQGMAGAGETALLRRIEHPQKRKFLQLYTEVGEVASAAVGAGIGRTTHYDWLASDPDYKAAFEGPAKEILADRMEAEMYRRAVKGVDKPIYHKGKKIDVIKQYSDILLIFGLKGALPEKYNEKIVQEHRGVIDVRHSYAVALPAGLDVIDVEAEEVKT